MWSFTRPKCASSEQKHEHQAIWGSYRDIRIERVRDEFYLVADAVCGKCSCVYRATEFPGSMTNQYLMKLLAKGEKSDASL